MTFGTESLSVGQLDFTPGVGIEAVLAGVVAAVADGDSVFEAEILPSFLHTLNLMIGPCWPPVIDAAVRAIVADVKSVEDYQAEFRVLVIAKVRNCHVRDLSVRRRPREAEETSAGVVEVFEHGEWNCNAVLRTA